MACFLLIALHDLEYCMIRGTIEVVIPAHNAAPFLGATLRSVALQSLLPDRVTVVDDSSTDGTAEVATACAAEYAGFLPIRVMRNHGPRGPAAARNMGIRESQAEFVALLDADDLLVPRHHDILVAAMRAAGDIVVSFGDSTEFDAHGTVVPSLFAKSGVDALRVTELAPFVYTPQGGIFGALLKSGIFGTSASFIRREAAVEIGLHDETLRFHEDTDFYLRLALRGRFAFTREILMHKRVHGGNMTHPRNTISFNRGKVLSLTKLSAEAERLKLNAAEQDALHAELSRAIDDYTYFASREGGRNYGDALHLARAAGKSAIALKPRHLARMVLHGMAGKNRVA
jgi:glycosyltransferase involved in cell wall biosynthesis